MTRAMVCAFHRQEPAYQDNYKVLLWLFLRHAWGWIRFVDRLYVIDSGCGFTKDEMAAFVAAMPEGCASRVSFIPRPPDSHWGNFNAVIRNDVKEDIAGLIDSDMLVYHAEKAILMPFMAIESGKFDAVGILDNSGNADLSAYPLMNANENREARKRLAPYLCFFKRSVLRPDFDFTAEQLPIAYDSMGKITHQMLEDGVEIGELRDDRSTIYLEDDNRITSTQWLDSPPKLWATGENPNLGYYHIRNFSGGLNLANSYWIDPKLHEHFVKIIPRREALRLLLWLRFACESTGVNTNFMVPAICNVLKGNVHAGIAHTRLWTEYSLRMRDYYPWIEIFGHVDPLDMGWPTEKKDGDAENLN